MTRTWLWVDFPSKWRAERLYFKALFWPLQNPLCRLAGTLLCLLYSVFITADQETPEANSSQGMFPLVPGGRPEQSQTLPESRREHYVNHKSSVKIKQSSASAFRGCKRLQVRELTWSPLSRYDLRTVWKIDAARQRPVWQSFIVLWSDVSVCVCAG